MNKQLAITALVISSSFAGMQAFGDEAGPDGSLKDAWIGGKLEAVYALNRHLSAFAITTEVENGIVHLTGDVESDIDRDLAAELAKGIEGVVEVDNDLEIAADARDAAAPSSSSSSDSDRSFGVWIDDATTTATVKSRLLANPNTGGLQIDVDTRGDVVTLTGEVGSAEEKALAEELARNTGDVKDVRNQLIVREMVATETT
jgi:osmotically-inducible protein OsmY